MLILLSLISAAIGAPPSPCCIMMYSLGKLSVNVTKTMGYMSPSVDTIGPTTCTHACLACMYHYLSTISQAMGRHHTSRTDAYARQRVGQLETHLTSTLPVIEAD